MSHNNPDTPITPAQTTEILVLESSHFDDINPNTGLPTLLNLSTYQLSAFIDEQRYLAANAATFGAVWDLYTCQRIEKTTASKKYIHAIKYQSKRDKRLKKPTGRYEFYKIYFFDGQFITIMASPALFGKLKWLENDRTPQDINKIKHLPSLMNVATPTQEKQLQALLVHIHAEHQYKKLAKSAFTPVVSGLLLIAFLFYKMATFDYQALSVPAQPAHGFILLGLTLLTITTALLAVIKATLLVLQLGTKPTRWEKHYLATKNNKRQAWWRFILSKPSSKGTQS